MAISKIKTRDFASIQYDIPNDTDAHNFNYPADFNSGNCALISASCYTKYSSWVDSSYSSGEYFGNFKYDTNHFVYSAKVAGNSSKIIFTFAKL